MSAQPAFLYDPARTSPAPAPAIDAPVREARTRPQPAPAADPDLIREDYFGNARLLGRVALITGGEAGIGRAVALHYAREGARVVIAYTSEDADEEARECQRLIRTEGSDCLLFRGDLRQADTCRELVARAVEHFGHIDVVVNNAVQRQLWDVRQPWEAGDNAPTLAQLERAFRNQVLSYLLTSVEALPKLRAGGSIINTVPAVGLPGQRCAQSDAGSEAIHAFTQSLAEAAAERGIRVNAVAPGPVWTAGGANGGVTGSAGGNTAAVGAQTLLGRAGLPAEVAPAYVFLASDDATFITGQTIHINGGGKANA